MTLKCRIKKALGIQSPSADGYCKVNLHCNNKDKCMKCKHFKISEWNAFVCGKSLVDGIKKAIESVNALCEALSGTTKIKRKKHKCDGCKYKGEHQEMMFRPFEVCMKETNLCEAEKAYNADVCPYKTQERMI